MSEYSDLGFFGVYQDNTASGGVLRSIISNETDTTVRSNSMFVPADSTLAIHISATATVQVISNPFGDPAKDMILDTVTATNQFNMPTARHIILNVTANTGIVTATIVENED